MGCRKWVLGVVVSVVVFAGGASNANAIAPIPYWPSNTTVYQEGDMIEFGVIHSSPTNVWAEISTSPTVNASGILALHYSFIDLLYYGNMDWRGESILALYPRTYYWQAYLIDCWEDPDCYVEGEIRSFTVTAKAVPQPPPVPTTNTGSSGISTLSVSEAKSYTRKAIKMRIHRYPQRLKRSCYRYTQTKIVCRVRWTTAIKRYSGRMTIWISESDGKEYWDYSFRGTSTKLKCKSKRKSKCKKKVRWG